MSAVVKLETEKPVNKECIETLERMLDRAKAGELQGLAIGAVCFDGSSTTACAGVTKMSGYASQQALMGTLTHLIYRLNRAMDNSYAQKGR